MPKHGVPLIRTPDPGIGICPISDCRFTYDEQAGEKTGKLKLNALGEMVEEKDWKVTQVDGSGG